jgi:hypothetical protein
VTVAVINIEDVLLNAVAQAGDRYEFGAAVNFNNPDPDVFDCSGLSGRMASRSSTAHFATSRSR